MTKYQPSTERPGAAFKRQNGQALKNEQLRLWLLEQEKAVDGAIHFDRDMAAVEKICVGLLRQLRTNRLGSLSNENRDTIKKLLGRIIVEADDRAWTATNRPDWYLSCDYNPFDRQEIVGLMVARDARKMPHTLHEIVGRWISNEGDLNVFDALMQTGVRSCRHFALFRLDNAIRLYFNGGIRGTPSNWPALVLKRLDDMKEDATQDALLYHRAQLMKKTINGIQGSLVRAAISAARRPFQA